jgi:hypothetical protein
MKLSFIPGNLHLSETASGYVLMVGGMEVFRTPSEKSAVTRFKHLRTEMEKKYPGGALSPEERAEIPTVTPEDVPVESNSSPKGRRKAATHGTRAIGGKRPVSKLSNGQVRSRGREAIVGTESKPITPSPAGVKPLDTIQIVVELRRERDRISQAIAALEALESGGNGIPEPAPEVVSRVRGAKRT